MGSPGLARPAASWPRSRLPSLSMLMVRTCGTATVSLSSSWRPGPGARSASTSAVLSTWPASMSAWVDGVGGGARAGLARIERGRPPAGQVTVDRRVGRRTTPVEGHVAGVLEVEGVADRSPGLARRRAPSRRRRGCRPCRCSIVTTCGTSTVSLSSSLAAWSWGPRASTVGGVVDLAGVDVGLVDGIGGGARGGLTRIERGRRRPGRSTVDRRVGDDDAVEGHVAGVGRGRRCS